MNTNEYNNNIPSTKEEWQTATAKILTPLDKPTK